MHDYLYHTVAFTTMLEFLISGLHKCGNYFAEKISAEIFSIHECDVPKSFYWYKYLNVYKLPFLILCRPISCDTDSTSQITKLILYRMLESCTTYKHTLVNMDSSTEKGS